MSNILEKIPTFVYWIRLLRTSLPDLLRGQITGAKQWKVVLAASDLPENVTLEIASAVHHTKLWPRERLDIARELVDHFQDAIEAGNTPEDAIRLFGDPQAAAKLIRRAKRRCRPLWWQAWWWISRSTAALLGIYLALILWLGGVKPQVTTDYFAVLNEGALDAPVEDRAWPIYLDIARSIYIQKNEGTAGLADSPIEFEWEPHWDEMSKQEAATWLAQRQDLIKRVRQAATKPALGVQLNAGQQVFSNFDPVTGELLSTAISAEERREASLYSTLLGHVQSMRGYVRLLRHDAIAAAERGDREIAVADIVAMLSVSDHAGQGGNFLVAGLVRMACESLAMQTVNEVMAEHPHLFTTDDLATLAHAFAAIEYPSDCWLGGERFAFYDSLQRLYSDNGDGDGFVTAEGIRKLQEYASHNNIEAIVASERSLPGVIEATIPVLYFAVASRQEVREMYDRFIMLAVADATTPLYQWKHRWGAAENYLETQFGSMDKQLRYYPISLLAPGITPATNAFHRAHGQRDGVLVGLALELYRRDQGNWPASLEELSPRWLPKIPVDQINGGPLGYRIIDGKPIVYSLGVDSDDDGGRLPPCCEGDIAKYRVHSPYQREATPHASDEDGDWVLWSLAPSVGDAENVATEQEVTTP